MPDNDSIDINYSKLTINSLFQNHYIVPEYQREYVWTEKEVEQLLTDLFDSYELNPNKPYFMGMIVAYSNGNSKYEVIDGQQRITTFFIMICAIIHFYKNNNLDSRAFEGRLNSVDIDEHTGVSVDSFALELQYENNNAILEKIFKNEIDYSQIEDMADSSEKKLYEAYDTIAKYFKNNYSEISDFCKFALFLWNKVQMVQIESKDISDSLKIFETINQRGKGLNSLDLLKNMIFMQVQRSDFSRLNEEWKRMMDKLQSVEDKPLRFLRYFITANYDITDQETGTIKGILSEDSIYDWMINNNEQCRYKEEPFAFLNKLSKGVDSYAEYIKPNPITQGNDYIINISRIAGSSYKSHMVLLLASGNMDGETLLLFKRLLESIVYYTIINGIKGNETEKIFAKWASNLKNIHNRSELIDFVNSIVIIQVNAWISEKNYKQRFVELSLNNIQKYRIKYILARISKYVDEIRANGNNYADISENCEKNIEIEHIMPQECPNYGNYNMLDENEFSNYLMLIGNLTLLEKTQNSACKNKTYIEKKDYYQNSRFYLTKSIHKLSSIGNNNAATRMDNQLKQWPVWNKETILERGEQLFELAEKIWKIDNFIS